MLWRLVARPRDYSNRVFYMLALWSQVSIRIREIWLDQFIRVPDRWVLLLIVSFSWWLMSFTFQYKDNQFVMASKVWSDFGAHLPLIRSFSMGLNFPPEYPQFPGESIRYHYLFYALVGWLELAGVRIDFALNILSALGLSLLLWMIYLYAKSIARSVAGGLVAVVLVLSNGSFSWWQFTQRYLQMSELSSLWQIVSGWLSAIVKQTSFTAFGPWDGGVISAFWTLNVYTNQRHLPLSYGLVLLLLWPLVKVLVLKQKYVLSRWWAVGMIFVMSVFPLLHQAGVVILLGSILVVVLLHINRKLLIENWRLLFTYGMGMVVVLGAMYTLVPTGHPIHVKPWFLANHESWLQLAKYWWLNIGLYSVLCVPLLWWRHHSRVFTVLALGLLIVTNIWQLSPDMINNHKLVNFALLYLAISVSSLLVSAWRNSATYVYGDYRKFSKPVVRTGLVILFFGLIFGGIVDFFPIVNDHKIIYADWPLQPVAVWIKQNTAPESVFLTTEFFYHPANSVGRKIFVDYGYFAWSLGYKDQERRAIMRKLFGSYDSLSDWCQTARMNGIDYIAINPRAETIDDQVVISDSFVVTSLQPTAETSDGYRIYRVAASCQSL